MEINLSLISEDSLNIQIHHEIINELNKQEEEKIRNENLGKIIKEEINKNFLFLKNVMNEEYFDVKIYNNETPENIIEVKSKNNLKEDIENKINSCMEKEKILLKKQEEINKINESIIIDEKILEKKLISLLEINKEEYEKIIDQLVEQILDYDFFIKDAKNIQTCLIKYRDSLIIARCYKIYIKKFTKAMDYILDKSVIFLNNDKLLKMLNCLFIKLDKKIINEIYERISQKIIDKEIFINHKEEYEEKLNFYKEVCYLLPIIKIFEISYDKEIFELEEDVHLEHSENIFDEILRIDNQIPKRNGLNNTLNYFKEHTNIEQACEMTLRRILLIKKKYNVELPNFKRSSFLYE